MNEHRMFLFTCIRTETISRVHGEINEIPRHSFAALAHIGWFRVPAPLNARAIGIDQLLIEPLHNDLLIIGGIRTVTRRVWRRRLSIQVADKSHSQREPA